MSWAESLTNPYGTALKKTAFQILQERYGKNQQILDRVAHNLTMEQDVRAFLGMLADVYELGYMKAVEDHREGLKKAGLVARIVSPESQV